MKRRSVRTFSGAAVDLLDASLESISIEDIAHHLSMLPRYNGAMPFSYTVGQHSLFVAELLPEEFKLWGLLHDATEAYLGDLVSPVKDLLSTYDDMSAPVFENIDSLLAGQPSAETKKALEQVAATLKMQKDTCLSYRDIERKIMTRIADKFLLGMPSVNRHSNLTHHVHPKMTHPRCSCSRAQVGVLARGG